MSRFEAAVHNTGHHAVSGFSDLLQAAYQVCETERKSVIEIDLLTGQCFPHSLEKDVFLNQTVKKIRKKFIAIVESTSGVKEHELATAQITIDFLFQTGIFQNRRKNYERIGTVYYKYNPVYEFKIAVTLVNGRKCIELFEDKAL